MKMSVHARKALSMLAACALAFGLVPAAAFAASAEGGAGSDAFALAQRSEQEIDAAVETMLAAGGFEEGEALVCSMDVAGGASAGSGLTAQEGAPDLLAGAEELSSVTAEQYCNATGEALPAAQSSAPGTLTAQAADESVRIALVHREDMSTAELLRALLRDPRVLSAEPNYVMGYESDEQERAQADEASALSAQGLTAGVSAQEGDEPAASPADLASYQWFSSGVAATTSQYADGANPGVGSPNWNDAAKTNASGVVAIMDSGVDYTHPDLKNVMYHFSPELQEQLGCGEFGYAPLREGEAKKDPMDGLYHGTHVAGIVAAEWNGFGVSGIANGAKICAVSIAKSVEDSSFTYGSIIQGYDFLIRAAQAGVDIRAVNRSLACMPVNNANQVMIQAAGEAGIVTCIASGNSSDDLDVIYDDASMLQASPYVLRVDASKVQDDRAGFSCIGKYATDVFAPGAEILSTIPSNKESESRYFPQVDSDPLYLETAFDGELFDVAIESQGSGSPDSDAPSAKISGVARGSYGADGDSASLEVNATVPVNTATPFCVDVPVGDLDKGDVQDIGVALYSGGGDVAVRGAPYSSLTVLREDGTYAQDDLGCDFFGSPGGWSYGTVHVADPETLEQGFKKVTDTHGRTCIRLRIAPQIEVNGKKDNQTADVTLSFDLFAVGKRGNAGFLPYQFMNGTSMATPVVTGCAAVVSSGITGVAPDVRAAQTVRKLKGAVHQADGYRDLCKQNGQVDLRKLGSESGFVPVLESAQVRGASVTVRGAYLGGAGTLTVGGVEVEPAAWSQASITASWPAGVASGLVPISVKTADGAEACRAFALAAPETVAGSAELYERDLLPIGLKADGSTIMETPQALAATDDGVLFAAVADGDDNNDATVKSVLRRDGKSAAWTRIALPKAIKNVSLAMGDDMLYIWGATPADDPAATDGYHLYGVSISGGAAKLLRDYTTSWGDIDPEDAEAKACGQIAYANGALFYVFALDETPEDGDATTRMCVQRFNADYSLGEMVTSKYTYTPYSFLYGPKVAATGNSIYVCGLIKEQDVDMPGNHRGLERVDVDADGTITMANLSAAVAGVSGDVEPDNICMAASEQGLFLIGDDLEGLVPAGGQRISTDTYLLKPGATAFEAYSKTLSHARVLRPSCAVGGGWLYAYGASKYEDLSVFGRATELPAAPAPEPADNTPKKGESRIVGNYLYTVQSSTTASVGLSIAGLKSLKTANIPAVVKLGRKSFKVTAVATEGFAGARKLAKVSIGSNVETIGPKAFSQNAKLASMTGGAAVKTIGKQAFAGCARLKVLKITSSKLARIGAASFKGCKQLKTLSIAQTAKLTKAGVKGSLTSSYVKTVDVKNSKKAAYKKIFAKKNCGKKVKLT